VLRQRELYQDAVEFRVGVQLLHQIHQLDLKCLSRKVEGLRVDASLFTRTALVADVHSGCGVISYKNNGQPGHKVVF